MKVFTTILVIASVVGLFTAERNVIESKVNRFGNKLNAAIAKSQPDKNTFFSPLGLHLLLSYLSVFMGDEAAQTETFALLEVNQTQVLGEYKNVMDLMKIFTEGSIVLKVLVTSHLCLPEFKPNSVLADITPAGLADTLLIVTQNDSCKSTNVVHGETQLAMNANWAKENAFNNEFTMPFTDINGVAQPVTMLSQLTENLHYKKDDDLQAEVVKLSFEEPSLKAVFLIPDASVKFSDFETKLVDKDIDEILATEPHEGRINLFIPKVSLDTKLNMGNVLINAGYDKLVNDDKFFGIYYEDNSVVLEDIEQVTKFTLDKEGAHIESNSTVEGSANDVTVVKVDRPFYVYLYYELMEDKVVLFQGRVVAPLDSEEGNSSTEGSSTAASESGSSSTVAGGSSSSVAGGSSTKSSGDDDYPTPV